MRRLVLVIAVLAVLLLCSVEFQAQQTPNTAYGAYVGGFAAPAVRSSSTVNQVTYTAGTLYLGGTAKSISAGTVTGLASNKTNCDAPAFSACEIIYWTSGSTLTHTTSIITASVVGNIPVAYVTLNSGGTVTAIRPVSLVLPKPIYTEESVGSSTPVAFGEGLILRVGSSAFSTGTVTISNLPFTGATTYGCTANIAGGTTSAYGIAVANTNGSTAVFKGSGSDVFYWMCVGK